MRSGDIVYLEAGCNLHPFWRLQHPYSEGSHVWAYEQDGPTRWRARITRRNPDE